MSKIEMLMGIKKFDSERVFTEEDLAKTPKNNNATAVLKQSADNLSRVRSNLFDQFGILSTVFDNLSAISPEVSGFDKSDLQEVADKVLEAHDSIDSLVYFLMERYKKVLEIQKNLFHS